MILNTNAGSSEKIEPKVGLTQAVLSGVTDMGTQDTDYGKKRQIMLTWELPKQTHVFDEDKGEQPLIRTKTFTMSLHEKSGLRKALRGMIGKDLDGDIDLFALIGTNCMLNLVKSADDKYINIDSITPLMDGLPACDAVEKQTFSLDEFDMGDYMKLYNWVKEKVSSSPEYKALDGTNAPLDDPSIVEDIKMPF